MDSLSIETTFGSLNFSFSGQTMNVLNGTTGENIYSGDVDSRILSGGEEAKFAAQELAEAVYSSDEGQ